MWKPTKTGVYLLNGRSVGVFGIGSDVTTWQRQPPEDGPWSLLAPDWQPGAPTVAQLERWQWWATWWSNAAFSAAEIPVDAKWEYSVFGRVLRSAPIQPDLSNGPLWVPLEVAK